MKTVLIVDDKPEVRELIEVTLRIGDYRFLCASSGPQGVAMASESCPDIVIMDVMMPGEYDGLEAVRRIRANPDLREVSIIMLTAKSSFADSEAGLATGADAYLTKPFGPLELMRTVDRVLQSREGGV
jgi:two-component system phosphate regulon response regulator PhoB